MTMPGISEPDPARGQVCILVALHPGSKQVTLFVPYHARFLAICPAECVHPLVDR